MRDVDGVFVEVVLHMEGPREDCSIPEPSEEQEMGRETAAEVENLCVALGKAQSEKEALVEKAKIFQVELEREKECVSGR